MVSIFLIPMIQKENKLKGRISGRINISLLEYCISLRSPLACFSEGPKLWQPYPNLPQVTLTRKQIKSNYSMSYKGKSAFMLKLNYFTIDIPFSVSPRKEELFQVVSSIWKVCVPVTFVFCPFLILLKLFQEAFWFSSWQRKRK